MKSTTSTPLELRKTTIAKLNGTHSNSAKMISVPTTSSSMVFGNA